jgi:hypothetical protein
MSRTDSIKLSMIDLPVIKSMDDFSEITHISKYTLINSLKILINIIKHMPYLKKQVRLE